MSESIPSLTPAGFMCCHNRDYTVHNHIREYTLSFQSQRFIKLYKMFLIETKLSQIIKELIVSFATAVNSISETYRAYRIS